MGTFLGTVEAVPKWGDELKKVTALTSRSMITPFLESFPEDFNVEVAGDTYTAKLAGNEADAQPASRRLAKKQTAAAAPKLILTRTADAKKTRTTTRTRRSLK